MKLRYAMTIMLATSLCMLPASAQRIVRKHTYLSPRDSISQEIFSYGRLHASQGSPERRELAIQSYKGNPAGLTVREIDSIYEAGYKSAQSIWHTLIPQVGWLMSMVLMLILVLRKTLERWTTRISDSLAIKVEVFFEGSPMVNARAVARYKEFLISRFSQLRIPFSTRALEMRRIYVPVKLASGPETDRINPVRFIEENTRAVIVGPPGSGKSMLLKQLALIYSDDTTHITGPRYLPIYLELHRFGTNTKASITEQLAEEFIRTAFRRPQTFIDQQLEAGALILLFDGLDEVNASQRDEVVAVLRDFMDQYPEVKILVTCRTAVYQGELTDRAETLQILEFSDQQIRRFLHAWEPFMPAEKSVEQLVQTLRDRPTINGLARNPLLLTIISYLYTETPHVLPHSRTEFYRQATDVLLHQWHQDRNKYEARDKNSVLQSLALFFQDHAQQEQDRRSVDYEQVLAEVERVLPALNLDPHEDTRPILNEIVERSGLLLAIDRGQRYQFAHLTLQEYFAAAKLGAQWKEAYSRFKGDPDTWRETVKLWCGLGYDSGQMLSQIFQDDALLAFECLADARQIDPEIAERILETAKILFSSRDNQSDSIVRAFGVVASDSRSRGANVLQFLCEKLCDGNAQEKRLAIDALSASNLPSAAREIAQVYGTSPEARLALVRMGDLAVQALARLAQAGTLSALSDLRRIGTPAAAIALVPSLWHGSPQFCVVAAWALGALLSNPDVEDALKGAGDRRGDPDLNWIWEPFEEKDPNLRTITARIVEVLRDYSFTIDYERPDFFDVRLTAAYVCCIKRDEIIGRLRRRTLGYDMAALLQELVPTEPIDAQADILSTLQLLGIARLRGTDHPLGANGFVKYVSECAELARPEVHMLEAQDAAIQLRLLTVAAQEPSIEQWKEQFRKPIDNLDSWQMKALTLLWGVLVTYSVVLACAELVFKSAYLAPVLTTAAIWAIGGYAIAFHTGSATGVLKPREPRSVLRFVFLGLRYTPSQIWVQWRIAKYRRPKALIEGFQLLVCAGWLPALFAISTLQVNGLKQAATIGMIWFAVLAISVSLLQWALRLDRASHNPFKDLFVASEEQDRYPNRIIDANSNLTVAV